MANQHHKYLTPVNTHPVTILGEDDEGRIAYVQGHLPVFLTVREGVYDENGEN